MTPERKVIKGRLTQLNFVISQTKKTLSHLNSMKKQGESLLRNFK